MPVSRALIGVAAAQTRTCLKADQGVQLRAVDFTVHMLYFSEIIQSLIF